MLSFIRSKGLSGFSKYSPAITTGVLQFHHSYFLTSAKSIGDNTMKFEYPVPRRDETVVDNYHGTEISDPYRWMEDPDSEETQKFVDEENALTTQYLESFPLRGQISDRLTKLWNFPRYSCPYEQGNRYFYYLNTGLQNQHVLYMQMKGSTESSVFFDVNELAEDGTVSTSTVAFSEDNKTFSYGLSTSGSDWITGYFKDVETGKDYPEKLEKIRFSDFAWTHDNKGVFYGCYSGQEGKNDGSGTEENINQKVYYHIIGTPQESDILAVEFPDEPRFIISSKVSDCGRWLILTPSKGCKDNLVYVSDLSKLPSGEITEKLPLISVITKIEADYEYVTNNDSVFIFRTNKDAQNYRLVCIDINNPHPDAWKVLIPEHEKHVLDWAKAVNDDKLVLCYIQDVKNVMQLHNLYTGKLIYTFPLEPGTIVGFSGKRKYKDIFYKFASFLTPGTIYQCDVSQAELTSTVYKEPELSEFDPKLYHTEQVFYSSKDGTRIPMFIISKKSMKKDGNNPCMLYGYGGFNISLLPSFGVSKLVFISNLNGIYAIPNIRGGGEYGEKWHNGGRFANKQNCFDDFSAAAEFLIKEKYTSPDLLSIHGGSNGGLLVAACANQRPELYKAVVASVGVMDMLRFHKFTIGHHWITDYGCSDNEEDFKYLIKYSPLHNIRVPADDSVQYPSTLLLTADHDDRVVPLHSLKFIATLQYTFRNHPQQKNPLLIRIETKAGHGAGKPTKKAIEEVTDMYCFIAQATHLKFEE